MGIRALLFTLGRWMQSEPPTPCCPLHGTVLVDGEAKIRYGKVLFSDAYTEARASLFPEANTFVLGGCVRSDESPSRLPTRYCPECREAERLWKVQDPMRLALLQHWLDRHRD